MAGVSDKDDMASRVVRAFGLAMHFRYQGTRGVDIVETAPFGLCRHRLGPAMRADHDRDAFGDLIERSDEDGSHRLQRVHDIAVVNDLVPDLYRRTNIDRESDG